MYVCCVCICVVPQAIFHPIKNQDCLGGGGCCICSLFSLCDIVGWCGVGRAH